MPVNYLRRISDSERTAKANFHLGGALAFVAGAANAGGFLAVQQYTSHMTGIVSGMADDIVLGQFTLVVAGLAAVSCFVCGAMLSSWLVNWARGRRRRSEFALPLLLEAALLMVFGLLGARINEHVTVYVSVTVLLLCFIMGLQNALITKVSKAEIRTTHVTGLITDIGIELGRLLYWARHARSTEAVMENRQRLHLHAALVLLFFIGAVLGAFGFKHIGFQATIPLALLLMLLSMMPVLDDLFMNIRSS